MPSAVGTPSEATNPGLDTAIWSHTTPAGADLLIVAIGIWDDTPGLTTVASVDYNGQALQRIPGLTPPSTAAGGLIDLWYLLAPPEGAHDVTVILNATQAVFLTAGVTFDDVDQATSFGTPATNTGTDLTISVDVGSDVGDLVFDSFMSLDGAPPTGATPGANQTELHDQIDSGNVFAGGTEPGASPTVTMSWTLDGAEVAINGWAIAGVALHPVGAGAVAGKPWLE